jgi:hypothetical protein
MQTTFATENTPGKANEDYAVCGPRWAVILDGATAPANINSGCIHDVPWLVRHLAAGITHHLVAGDALSLPDLLADAIKTTMHAHEDTCDLSNPDSPSSTVAIIRFRDSDLDYLVLGDSPVILRAGQGFREIKDDRTDHLPGGRPYTHELVTRMRNKSGGFWVASTNPEAAYQAVSGNTDDAMDAAMLTDGVTRLVDLYGYDWQAIFAVLDSQGPSELISMVRAAERRSPPPHGKPHDDATAIYVRFPF